MTSPARTARPSPRKNPRPQGAEGGGGEQLLKIGEAAKALGVEAYVLRFWETQFPFLRPRHAHSKHRFYGAQDLQTLRLIKRLLHEERFTIEGAKKYIREVGLERALSAKPGAANGGRINARLMKGNITLDAAEQIFGASRRATEADLRQANEGVPPALWIQLPRKPGWVYGEQLTRLKKMVAERFHLLRCDGADPCLHLLHVHDAQRLGWEIVE